MANPVIVDLLPTLQIEIYPPGIQVVGKFETDTKNLSYELTVIRMNTVIREVLKNGYPDPLTFYIHENWQSFATIAGVCSSLGIKPRVLVYNWRSVEIDLYEFYSYKGGGELQGVKRALDVIPEFPYKPQMEASNESK
jgi:hypothetical protein